MLEFREIKLKDAEKLKNYLNIDKVIMSDRVFQSLYIWKRHYRIGWCEKDGFLFIRNESLEYNMYYMPLGSGDIKKAVELIYATEKGNPFFIALITDQKREEIQNCLDASAVVFETEEEYDYIYSSSDLIGLTGKKYQSKRNFINRFKVEYDGRWSFEAVDPQKDREEILCFLEKWMKIGNRNAEDFIAEEQAVKTALDNYNELGFLGAKLLLDGKIIAFTLAAKQNDDVMDILIEKADETVGAYQMINNEFARAFCGDVTYINREEDMGIEGLKKAKLSYQPVFLVKKYAAECNRETT
ncbi:MAG: DUF2156 domain-containing protein [Clostridia bacterium]|nr:DUF2156 domain-containing protein [Clostridia bacterium]